MKDFLTKEIWHVQIATLPKWKGFCYRLLRILMLTSQGFTRSQIQQGASALTYYSMLSVVPVIALLIGIARGFRLENTLQAWLISRFAEQKVAINQLFKFAGESLQATSGGVIAGVGVSLLLWSAIKILLNIELVMNQIWEVKEGRSLARKFTDYLAMLFLAPILIFLASGMTGYMSALLAAVHHGELFEQIAPLLIPLLSLVSFLLTSLFFTFLYIFMPNTRVRFLPALFAGIFTGVIYQVLQWLYFYFQIGVASYNAIYGTFAAIPLFLIWLHLSWVMILLGAKVCFAVQNVNAYEFISEDLHLSQRFRLICSLRLAQYCVKKFVREESPPSALELSNRLAIPLPLTTRLLHQLVGAEVLAITKREHDQEEAYQPRRSPETLTIKRTIDMINERGEVIPLPPSHELTIILKTLEQFSDAMDQSGGNMLLKDIS
ncbi:YihY/virulence factor BrkB family protein [Chlamydiota bacterium]